MLFFKTPEKFRQWLADNHATETELWVCYYKKGTKLPSITWPESVDEALCYGWIDGLRKRIDEEAYKIRFTPRRKNSHWSKVNLERYPILLKEGRIQPTGQSTFENRNKENQMKFAYEQKSVSLDPLYEVEIRKNETAWEYFDKTLSPSSRKAAIHWVMTAKQEKTRLRRLGVLIESSAEGRKIPQHRRRGE